MAKQQDNATLNEKTQLRRAALKLLAESGIEPVICETHGGNGVLFDACYAHLTRGVVFEKDARKAATLGKQRPTWAVYEADCEMALAAGVGAHLTVTLLDIDPYGSPWEALDGFFGSARPFAPAMLVVVNDGLREALEMKHAWQIHALRPMVERHGNDLYPIYLEICREMLETKAALAGYAVRRFHGYYCGKRGKMTHYLSVLCQA